MRAIGEMLRTRRAKQNRRHRERSKISSRRNLLERLEGRQLLAAAPFSESFDTFAGAGFVAAPAAGQLDSDDWRVDGLSAGAGTFGGTHDTNDFARGTSGGGETTGGVYAFNTGGNNILGVQPSGADFTPGDITLKIDNTSGSAISNWTVNYDVWEYNDQDRSSSLNLWVSADDVNYSQVGGSYDYTTVEAAAGTPAWGSTAIAGTVNQPVADGGSLYLQWRSGDVGGGGSRDEFGIDNVVVQDAGGTFFNISPVDASKPEGTGGGTTAFTFEITRTGVTSGTNDVTWTKMDVDTNGSDFSGTLADSETFTPGQTSRIVTINVNADSDPESNEAFTVDLSAATGGAAIGTGTAAGSILDDDTPIPSPLVINEFVFNHTGTDSDDFIEVKGPAATDLSGFSVLVIEGDGGGTGTVDNVLSLGTTNSAGPSSTGYVYAGGGLLPNMLENGAQTLLLVQNNAMTASALGADLDTDDDGVLDVTTFWSSIVDNVAVSNGFSSERTYSSSTLTPATMDDGNTFIPGGASRVADGLDTDTAADWFRNDFDGENLPSFGFTGTLETGEALNTPLATNSIPLPNPAALNIVQTGDKTEVSEDGMTDSFTIGLSTNPSVQVDITISPDNQTKLSADGITYGAAGADLILNYNNRLPQTVFVMAEDDAADEAAMHSSSISIDADQTGNPDGYDTKTGAVSVTVGDNDGSAPPAAFLNEFVINHRGFDTDDFVEIITTSGANLEGLVLLDVDGDGTGGVGRVQTAELAGVASGNFYVINQLYDNNANFLLVEGYTGFVGQDLDVDDDGEFDFDEVSPPAGGLTTAPWTLLRDAVSAPGSGDESYGLVELTPASLADGNSFDVGGASRIPDATGATTAAGQWVRNDFEGDGLPNYPFEAPAQPSQPGDALNTPGLTNEIISGLRVFETFGNTTAEEGAAGDTLQLSLIGDVPTSNVSVTITPDAELELNGMGSGTPIVVTFTAPFQGPISIDVDAFDDGDSEGPHTGTVSFSALSGDAAYAGFMAEPVEVNITDDELGTPKVVISEIMYDPNDEGGPPDFISTEWIEITNVGSTPVDIGTWKFEDEDAPGIDWADIPFGTTLPVLGAAGAGTAIFFDSELTSAAQFRSDWGVPASALVIGLDWGSLSNGASSTNEILQLLDSSGGVIDEVNFENGGPAWPSSNGSASIFLTDLAADNNVGTNWELHDTSAAPPQDPVPVNADGITGAPYNDSDVGSPGLVPAYTPAAQVSVSPHANGFEEGTVATQFLISLNCELTTDMTVTYSLSGSATPPPGPNNDYTDPAAGSVTIPAGSLSAVVTLPVVDDLTFEGTDDVTLTLGTVTMGSATVSASSGSATTLIIDNEVGPSYNPGDVIINEIMKDPDAVLDSAGEYFELYNTTGSPVDINGWTFSDNGSDSFTVSNGGPLEIPAGGYFVLGVNDDTGSNGGVSVDYEYDGSSWFLANGDDEVIAADAQGNEIDRVEYTDAFFPDQTGASLEFLPTLLGGGDDDTQNDVALNWQASQTTIGGGPDLGTPGAINSTPAPEINVTDDTAPTPLNILDGDTFPSTADGTDFGSTSVGTPVVNSFVLENEGPAPLTITGAPTFSGPDPTEFTTNLTAQTIPANSSVPFTITFLATATGTKNATINIPSDDSNENPYDFALTASAVTGLAPEITVESNFIEIVDGDTTPELADNTDFGSSDVAVGMARETYFITNDGTADLNIPVGGITISGAHAGDFTFDAASLALPAVITPGNTVPFSVDFDPSATGTRNATVNIANDDADENPYTFDITGNGVNATGSTVLINEIDSQDPAADDEQFVELYGPAGTSLDGLALVLFNGNATGDGSYDSIDLDGLTIPDDGGGFGYIVVGNAAVANLDLQFDGDLQNGADAVALYTGDATGFPFGTTPTTTNLRDAIVYDTGAADDAALLSALGETVQFNEDANGDDDNESLQRIPNGTDGDNFTAIAPTPGAINGVGDTTPPTITDVIVSGPAWSPTFIAAAGTNGVGYSLPGASQTRALPWSNITTLTIEFSEDVQQSGGADIDSTDLSLGGLNVLDYEAAGSGITTSYSDGGGAGPYRLTITLGGGAVFAADRLVLTVADTVEDAAGNALDGEWTNNVSTESGDSTAGGDFAFNFNVLPGDADGFGSVFSNDVFATNSIQFTFAGASPSYNIFNDFDGSGSIFSNDVFFVNGSQFTFLPSGSPIPPSPPPPAASGPGAAPLGAGLDLLSDEDDSWSADAVDEALASLY